MALVIQSSQFGLLVRKHIVHVSLVPHGHGRGRGNRQAQPGQAQPGQYSSRPPPQPPDPSPGPTYIYSPSSLSVSVKLQQQHRHRRHQAFTPPALCVSPRPLSNLKTTHTFTRTPGPNTGGDAGAIAPRPHTHQGVTYVGWILKTHPRKLHSAPRPPSSASCIFFRGGNRDTNPRGVLGCALR